MSRKSALRFLGISLGLYAVVVAGVCGVVAAATWTYMATRAAYEHRARQEESRDDMFRQADAAMSALEEFSKESRAK